MNPTHFVHDDSRKARLGYGKQFATELEAQGYRKVTAEEFEAFRKETRDRFHGEVAQ